VLCCQLKQFFLRSSIGSGLKDWLHEVDAFFGCPVAVAVLLAACVAPPPRVVRVPGPRRPRRNEYSSIPQTVTSPEQTERDRYECHVWAVQQTGVDPSRAGANAYERVVVQPAKSPGSGTVAGLIGGAIVGFDHRGSAAMRVPVAIIGGATGPVIGSAADANAQGRRNRPSNSSIRAQPRGGREPLLSACDWRNAAGPRLYRPPDTHVGHLTRMRGAFRSENESLGNDSHTEDRIAVGVHALVGIQRARSRPPMSATEAVPSRGRSTSPGRSARSSAGGTAGIRRPRQRLDSRYDHGRYYPPRGTVYRSLPDGYRPYYRGGAATIQRRIGMRRADPNSSYEPPPGLVISDITPLLLHVWIGRCSLLLCRRRVLLVAAGSKRLMPWSTRPTMPHAPSPPPPLPTARQADLIIYPKNGQTKSSRLPTNSSVTTGRRGKRFRSDSAGRRSLGNADAARSNYNRAMSAVFCRAEATRSTGACLN